MGLLTDIYNTVAKFFRQQDEQEGDASKSVATNRLKLVLMQDRTNLTPKILEQMRGEMIDLLSKYLEMDKDLLELNFEQEGDQVALMLSIPVIRAKDEDEIEEALQAAKAKQDDSEEENTDLDDMINEEEEIAEEEILEKLENSEKEISEDSDDISETECDNVDKTEDVLIDRKHSKKNNSNKIEITDTEDDKIITESTEV